MDFKYTDCFKCKGTNIEQFGDSEEDYYECRDCGHFRGNDEWAERRIATLTSDLAAEREKVEQAEGLLDEVEAWRDTPDLYWKLKDGRAHIAYLRNILSKRNAGA